MFGTFRSNVVFEIWTVRGDKLEGEENRTTKFGAILTVALAFFLAEMGDKTQLATIALAAKFPTSPVGVLIGTTTDLFSLVFPAAIRSQMISFIWVLEQ